MRIVLKSGSLNLLEASGPVQAPNETVLPLLFTTPSFHFVSKKFLDTKLRETLNDKEIYLKSDRGR
jgi:hypothetical protein